ncbi:MAG: DUF4870 domain-containing protein [Aureispira sp.]|nr:DUF4870 domain-containing protein [Aureispira sp.]
MKYDDLEQLFALKEKGILSEQEYQKEKEKILNGEQKRKSTSTTPTVLNQDLFGLTENSYCTLMHVSQLLGIVIPGLGFVAPIVLWVVHKDKNAAVDAHGRVILNWIVSSLIYAVVCVVLAVIIIGIPMLIALLIADIVFVVMGASKANEGELWKYPMSLKLF